MKHLIILTSVAVIMALTGYLSFLQSRYERQLRVENVLTPAVMEASFKDTPFSINGTMVQLIDGVSEVPAEDGSSSTVLTRYFGNEVEVDLNNDGMLDVAFLVTQEEGGTGTFYYVVAALKTADGYMGTNAVLLGDRIAPQTTSVSGDFAVFTYAVRAEGEPMTTVPSVGVTKSFEFREGMLREVKMISDPEVVVAEYYKNILYSARGEDTAQALNPAMVTEKVIVNYDNLVKESTCDEIDCDPISNPFICAQDQPDSMEGVLIETLTNDNSTAQVQVTLMADWTPIIVTLINSDGWKIDNIACPVAAR